MRVKAKQYRFDKISSTMYVNAPERVMYSTGRRRKEECI